MMGFMGFHSAKTIIPSICSILAIVVFYLCLANKIVLFYLYILYIVIYTSNNKIQDNYNDNKCGCLYPGILKVKIIWAKSFTEI